MKIWTNAFDSCISYLRSDWGYDRNMILSNKVESFVNSVLQQYGCKIKNLNEDGRCCMDTLIDGHWAAEIKALGSSTRYKISMRPRDINKKKEWCKERGYLPLVIGAQLRAQGNRTCVTLRYKKGIRNFSFGFMNSMADFFSERGNSLKLNPGETVLFYEL